MQVPTVCMKVPTSPCATISKFLQTCQRFYVSKFPHVKVPKCQSFHMSHFPNVKVPTHQSSTSQSSCITGNGKRLYHLSPSQNKCIEKPSLIGNLVTSGEEVGQSGRCETQLGLLNVPCWSSIPLHPPTWRTIWYAGRATVLYIYEYILRAELQFLSIQCWCYLVLWHNGSHRIIIFIISKNVHLPSSSDLRKSKLNLFRLSLCQFSY